jgi:flagellar hook assembly protein FlgD
MTSEARIDFALPKASAVDLSVYNISGQVVKRLVSEASKAPGRYSICWDGRNDQGYKVPGGVYFYRLKAGGFAETKKLVVVR